MLIVASIVAVPLAVLGIRALIAPANMAKSVGLEAAGAPGLSEIRSVLGGLLAGSAVLVAAGVATSEPTWFYAVAILMGVAVLGRLISLAADGFDATVVPPLLIELVIGTVMVATALTLG